MFVLAEKRRRKNVQAVAIVILDRSRLFFTEANKRKLVSRSEASCFGYYCTRLSSQNVVFPNIAIGLIQIGTSFDIDCCDRKSAIRSLDRFLGRSDVWPARFKTRYREPKLFLVHGPVVSSARNASTSSTYFGFRSQSVRIPRRESKSCIWTLLRFACSITK